MAFAAVEADFKDVSNFPATSWLSVSLIGCEDSAALRPGLLPRVFLSEPAIPGVL